MILITTSCVLLLSLSLNFPCLKRGRRGKATNNDTVAAAARRRPVRCCTSTGIAIASAFTNASASGSCWATLVDTLRSSECPATEFFVGLQGLLGRALLR